MKNKIKNTDKKQEDTEMTPEEVKAAVNAGDIVHYKSDAFVVAIADEDADNEVWVIVNTETNEAKALFDETSEDFAGKIKGEDFYIEEVAEDEPAKNSKPILNAPELDADGNPIEGTEAPPEFEPAPIEEQVVDTEAEVAIDDVQTQLDAMYEEVATLRGEVKRLLEENGELEDENTSIKEEKAEVEEELVSANRKIVEREVNELIGKRPVSNSARKIITGIYLEDRARGIEIIRAINAEGRSDDKVRKPYDNSKIIGGNRITGQTLAERVTSFKNLPKG